MGLTDALAQRLIDDEIRALKTRRNMHSAISKLPIEILARIFLSVKALCEQRIFLTLTDKSWLYVAGVCHCWREIALDTPRMWSSIDLSCIKSASTMLSRSKHAPLQVYSEYRLGTDTSNINKTVAELVMSQTNRIQRVDVECSTPVDFAVFCSLINMDRQYPALQRFRLIGPSGAHVAVMPEALLSSAMSSLRSLVLTNVNIPYIVPPLPQLDILKVEFFPLAPGDKIPLSLLLSTLQNTPNLSIFDLRISGETKISTSGIAIQPKIKLPRLSSASIKSVDLTSLNIFKHIYLLPSTTLLFFCDPVASERFDASLIVDTLSYLCEEGAPTITMVEMGAQDMRYKFTVRASSSHELISTIRVYAKQIVPGFPAVCAQLCRVLPLSKVTTLQVRGFRTSELPDLLGCFGMVKELIISEVTTNFSLFHALLKGVKEQPFLPNLRWLVLEDCRPVGRIFDESLENLFKERKVLDILELRRCVLRDSLIRRLKEYAQVVQDDDDSDSEEDDLSSSENLNSDDDMD